VTKRIKQNVKIMRRFVYDRDVLMMIDRSQ
jgi:hypothetical protein